MNRQHDHFGWQFEDARPLNCADRSATPPCRPATGDAMTVSHDLELPGPEQLPATDVPGIPRLAFSPISRRGLIAELDAAAEAPEGCVLLVCSPVGTGKSVLLTQWVERRRTRTRHGRVAWLRAQEATPALNLWRRLRPQLGLAPSARNAMADSLADATDLVEALTARGEPALVVIDDAHLITTPLTLAGLEYVLLHVPPGVTVVVSTRFEPPIRWHLLELGSRLRRWGPGQLAFSVTEAARLCRDQGCRLTDPELTMLMELTRGWAALVRIAAISLAARPEDSAAALTALSRLPASVSDLLAGELIDALPPGLRVFLTYTCVPAEFTEQLADDLVGGGAGHRLHELERLNYPLTSVVRKGHIWFAYHPMLRAYFRAELNRLGPELDEELQLRTALHLQSIGEPAAALPHVLALPQRRARLDFLRAHGLNLILRGYGPALFDALTAADAALAADPYLRTLRVVDALVRSDIAAARAHFDTLSDTPGSSESFVGSDMLTALTAAVHCELATTTGLTPDALRLSHHLPATGQPDLDCYAAIETATVLLVDGAVEAGEERLRRGLAAAEVRALPQLRLRALTRLGLASALTGSVTTMRRRAEHALRVAREHDLLETTEAAQLMALEVLGAYLQGDSLDLELVAYARAENTLLDGSIGANGGWLSHMIGTLMDFEITEDKSAAAQLLRTGFTRLLTFHPVATTSARLIPFVVWALLEVREPYEAQLLVEQACSIFGAIPEILIARAALASDGHRSRRVLELVEPLLDGSTSLHPVHRVTAWLLYAAAHFELGGTTGAHTGVENGVRWAAQERIVRPFLDVPGTLALLDRFTGSFGHHDAFVEMLRRHPLARRHSRHPSLTVTEFKVLRQLPSGRTSQQIADDLGVSINTVKTHLRNIYAKLGGNSRVDAVDRARRTGLL
ncbi:LuxR C-terminal-related transcriptional regulator [Nocardia aurantiaca]|uniref:HTH luxR-type domain-containing protein n=1 Tax=Nocardia aurantiaca TaxID=2675850 RepID=A0A6I3L5Q5_9NOCA|nr:LuxR C-terminal-related transcriptional regulator [Nocardia aurantiaca]MTE16688.1 hypothetical protein [Nocardia aurantiaca]